MENINVTKKKNNAGFTLIELIVVMALMAIIMGAILNFIEPTSKLYATTNAYLNQEEAVTSIYNVLNDDLMYATDVCVFTGVSNHSDNDGETVGLAAELINYANAQTGNNTIMYNNCIVLDNVNVRTATSKSEAKGATGSITKYALTDPTNYTYKDVTTDASLTSGNKLYTNYFALEDLTFMDDYKFFFTVEGPRSGQEQVLTLKTDVYSPTYNSDTGEYEFTENHFSAENSIEFVNINSGAATSNCDLDTSGPDTGYILIFYNRREKIPEATVNVNFECYILESDGSQYKQACTFTAPQGSDISQQVIDESESLNTIEPVSNTHVFFSTGMYSTTPFDPYVDGKVYYNLTSASGTGTIKLYAVYKKELKQSVPFSIKVYNGSDVTTAVNTMSYTRNYGESLNLSLSVPSGYDGAYYAYCGTTIEADLSNIKNNMDIYPYYYRTYTVRFQLPDGRSFKDGAFDMTGIQEDTLVVAPVGLLDDVIDEENAKQYSYALRSEDVFLSPIVGNTVIIIDETVIDIVTESGLVGSESNAYNNTHVIRLTNETDAEITEADITIKFDGNVSGLTFTGDTAPYSVVSISGNTVVINFTKKSAGWWTSLQPHGSTESLVFTLANNANITEITCVPK